MCVYHSVPSQSSAAAAKSLQSRPTLCNPIDGSPPGSSVPEFSRQEHWSGMPFPSPMHACMLSRFSRVRLCATPWRAAPQAPLSTGFSRRAYWSGMPFPSPMHACMLSRFSRVRLCVTPWRAAPQAPLSTGFSRRAYWSGVPFPSPVPSHNVQMLGIPYFILGEKRGKKGQVGD